MYALAPSREPELDQRVVIRGNWQAFKALLATRGETSVVRMYYLDGRIEIFSPASVHEFRKTLLARLLEFWALETDNDVEGFGSWTLEDEDEEVAAEPDECYVIGRTRKDVPDLVIEVEWSHVLGLSKQEIYKRLGVRELWTITKEAKLVIRVRVHAAKSCPRSTSRGSSRSRHIRGRATPFARSARRCERSANVSAPRTSGVRCRRPRRAGHRASAPIP